MSYRLPAPAATPTLILHRDATARRGAPRARRDECPVCLGQHEEEIHVATVRVRRWFRGEVTKGFVRSIVC